MTCHLLFQATVGANSSQTYYVYYGNPAATPPPYVTDLTSSPSGSGVGVVSSFFDVFLDAGSGIVSRVRLPQGSNTDLPPSPSSNYYWGWHQVCSGVGNVTGRNRLCVVEMGGGPTPGRPGVPLREAFRSPEAKRRYNRRMFATIAERYDFITVALSYGRDRRWKQRVASLTGMQAGETAVDLACGTGDIALRLADAGGHVVGLDLTPAMLALARRKDQARRIRLVQADMTHLPFGDASSDCGDRGVRHPQRP